MTAALAAIARLVLTAVLGAVLLLAVIAAMLWAWAGPQNWPLVAWLLAVCAVIAGASLGMSALQPEETAMGDGPALVCPGCGSRDVDVRRLVCAACGGSYDVRGGSYDVWGLDFGVEGGKA